MLRGEAALCTGLECLGYFVHVPLYIIAEQVIESSSEHLSGNILQDMRGGPFVFPFSAHAQMLCTDNSRL